KCRKWIIKKPDMRPMSHRFMSMQARSYWLTARSFSLHLHPNNYRTQISTMKKILLFLFAAGLFACQTADKKTGNELSQEEKDKAVRDTANFTTIEWLDSTVKDLGKIKE